MTDPVFKDRAELEAWRQAQVANFMANIPYALNQPKLMLGTANRINRVTLAHAHLFEEGK